MGQGHELKETRLDWLDLAYSYHLRVERLQRITLNDR